MFHLRARLDPVTAAPLKAALDALVGDALRRRGSGADPVVEDRRSIPQIQADALADLARHALGCESGAAVLAKTTIVVRLDLDALVAGTGLAEIDGIDRPIAASTARRLAADAEYIPAVLGGRSVPLDLGRSARLFTRAQRLALAERDGGCASCGQNITYADAHHIDWWTRDSGATDLSNGVMLCTACHRQIHDHGWNVRITDDTVWFIPPPHLDPAQTPRLGGKARYHPDPSPSPSPSPRRAPARDVGRNSALREDGAAASSPLNAHGSAGAA
jgi:5-methylcytosine-specific restriction protein A